MIAHRHERIRDVDGLRERHVDLPQRLEGAGPFHPRRFVELLRHRLECLTQQEDAECRGHVRQPDREHGVEDAQRRHRAVVLHDQHVRHDHELHEDEQEDDVAAHEREARERVGGQGAEHELRGEDHGHQEDRVEQIAGERRRVPGIREVLQGERRREDEPRGVLAGVEGRPHRVEQRQDPQRTQHPRPHRLEASGHVLDGP